MDLLVLLIIVGLAASGVAMVWLKNDGPVSPVRDRIKAAVPRPSVSDRSALAWLKRKVIQLLDCPICTCFQAAFWLHALCALVALSTGWTIQPSPDALEGSLRAAQSQGWAHTLTRLFLLVFGSFALAFLTYQDPNHD